MNIRPDHLTLGKLLENRLFRIPHYQRAYSWQRKQREDMFEDISKLKGNSQSSHFMATVVGLHRDGDTKEIGVDLFDVIDVVDGQQRLTTLVLLLKAIERKLNCSPPDSDEKQHGKDLQNLLVKGDDVSLILLQTNHDQSRYFTNFLRFGERPSIKEAREEVRTLADRELLSAVHECERFVDRWNNTTELLRIIKNQLTFIFHQIADEASVYTVFEVLNNRGLHVSWLDRLKSMLMSVAFEDNQGNADEHIAELHRIWGEIYGTIGLRQGLDIEALRFGATLKSPSQISKPFNEERAVESLIRAVSTSTFEAIKVSNWLLAVINAVNQVLGEMSHTRETMTKIAHARLLATAIILRKFPADEEKKLLQQWEKTSFRLFGLCRKDARTGSGDYVRLAWNTLKAELDADDISERLESLSEGTDHDIDSALRSIENSDCYSGWTDPLRYLLCRYEEYLAKEQGQNFSNEQWNRIWEESAAQSIEHILPQSRRWREGIFVDRLGNLLLLPPGLNSQLGNQDPDEKANDYVQTGLFCAAEVAQTIREEGWGAPQIEEREQKLLTWIRETWG
ncbi:DUF262 domain-containing protein [Candidatus Poribacteria bacterium]|nr:MAG: DUF262 domain-containing protein [Candidatus Poribacteria bacterium]